MNAWGMTDIGLVRSENQDTYSVVQESTATICVVCDGMGGASGGRLASTIAVEMYTRELSKLLLSEMSAEQLREASAYAVSIANEAVRSKAKESEDYRGMGTTLVSAVTYSEGVVVTNVGDSRAYRINQDGITRLTRDHSLVEHMVERGDITEEEARRHPNRNLITRALGLEEHTQCDGFICPLEKGDFVLLCSDGLTNMVSDDVIHETALNTKNPEAFCKKLIELALDAGANDNVTVVALSR